MEVYKRELAPTHCIFEIPRFSTKGANGETYGSDIFESGGCKWSLCLYPNGDKNQGGEGFISLYLKIEETDSLPSGWEVFINYKLFVLDQKNDSYLTIQDRLGAVRRFHQRKKEWGFVQLLSLESLRKNSNYAYLVDDTCVFGAEVFVLKTSTMTSPPQLDRNRAGNGMEVHKREQKPSHYIIKINNFSLLQATTMETYRSDMFEAGGYKWRLSLYPNGDKKRGGEGHISLYLNIVETDKFHSGWEVFVSYRLFIRDQNRDNYLMMQDEQGAVRRFHEQKKEWGFAQFLSSESLFSSSNGYVLDDNCILGAEVFVIKGCEKMASLTIKQLPVLTNKLTFRKEKFFTQQHYKSDSGSFLGCDCALFVNSGGVEFQGKHLVVAVEFIRRNQLPPKMRKVYAECKLRLVDQLHNIHHEWQGGVWLPKLVGTAELCWASEFIALEELRRPEKGFIYNGTVIIEAEILYTAETHQIGEG